jgi:flagellar hook-associated protein 3 FlgL
MRISTSQFQSMNVQAMDNQQAELAQLYGEISSGSAISTPSDNPLGAAQAVQLSEQGAALSQYATNQSSATTNLNSEDTTLTSVITALQSVHQQLVGAGDGTLNDTTRGSIATTLQGLENELVSYGNTTSPGGGYLFGGFQSASQPFTQNTSGAIVYNGDNGVSSVQISDSTSVATSDSGSSVFLSVTPQTASPVPAGAATNTGTGTIGAVSTSGSTTAAENDAYAINFTVTGTGSAAVTTYTVTDTTTGTQITPPVTTPATADPTYTAGSSIALGTTGMSVAISGAPANGDSFTVTPAANTTNSNIFSTIQSMITALQTPADTPTAQAALTNSLASGLTQVENTLNNVTAVQASVGGRTQQVEAMQTVTASLTSQNTTALSGIVSTNLTQTISQYTQTQYSLQASEQAFVQVQQQSLFQYLNQ